MAHPVNFAMSGVASEAGGNRTRRDEAQSSRLTLSRQPPQRSHTEYARCELFHRSTGRDLLLWAKVALSGSGHMAAISRRRFLQKSPAHLVAIASATALLDLAGAMPAGAQSDPPQEELSKEEWMSRWMKSQLDDAKEIPGQLWLGRFLDPMYYLLKTLSWKPNPPQAGKYAAVNVPTGFVTDLASIPWPLWSFLRPDGNYAAAAIIHDYLYWTQTRPREEADEILKFAMQDLRIDTVRIDAIYLAVRAKGQSPWDENAQLKARGERRILKVYPNATDLWIDFKKKNVFLDPQDTDNRR